MAGIKLVYQDVAPGAAEGSMVSQEDRQDFCEPEEILQDDVPALNVATLEEDFWALDGSFDIFPDDPSERLWGLWSKSMSEEDGRFSTPPVLVLSLDDLYSSVGITLDFAQEGLSWCNDLEISWYRGGTVIDSQEFFPDANHYICANEVRNYNGLRIKFISMTAPYRYLKLTRLIYGVTREFDNDERYSLNFYQAASPISETIEVNTMEASLRNKSAIPFMFQRKQPIQILDGEELLGVYYIDSSNRTGPNAYSLECSDRFMLLQEMADHKGGVYDGILAPELLDDVLGGLPYELDSCYSTAQLYGYLPAASRMDNLAQIAFALGAVVDTSRSDSIRIFAPQDGDPVEVYDENHRYSSGSSITRRSLVTEVQVTAHSYAVGTETTQLYNAAVSGTAQIAFADPVCALSITGGTIQFWGCNWAEITGTGETVTLTGAKYTHTTAVTTVKNPIIGASDAEKVIAVKDCTLIGPYNVDAVAQRVYDYYQRRDTISVKVLPGAAKPGDRVEVDTDFDGTRAGTVVSLDWTGSNLLAAQAEIILEEE
jgi:hypothetical protein